MTGKPLSVLEKAPTGTSRLRHAYAGWLDAALADPPPPGTRALCGHTRPAGAGLGKYLTGASDECVVCVSLLKGMGRGL
jgi:hypothetical protein